MFIDNNIQEAKKVLMSYWPLNAFIASNPLWSLRESPFFDVVSQPQFNALMHVDYYYQQYRAKKITDEDIRDAFATLEKRDISSREIQAWIAASKAAPSPTHAHEILVSQQLDEYQFQQSIVWIKEQMMRVLRDYFGNKHYQNTNLLTFWRQQTTLLPSTIDSVITDSTELTISLLLEKLKIPNSMITNYLTHIFLQVYGWSSLMNWRNHHPKNPWLPGEEPCETILLLWLIYEYAISVDTDFQYKAPKHDTEAPNPNLKNRHIWQTAFEHHYLKTLDQKLPEQFTPEKTDYNAQFIFCIDTRSEGFRRHLEKAGHIQTFGFAGFFGALFNCDNEGVISYQAPALVQASKTLTIQKTETSFSKLRHFLKSIISYTKKQLSTPFALFEILGPWFLPFMLYKTLQPKCQKTPAASQMHITNTFTLEEQYEAAIGLLTAIGLTKHFSDHVLICAHQSDNINNPFKPSLDCGACGGNSGIPNAIIMTQILNNPDIREKLNSANIIIPEKTQFIAACHHTTDDRLEILDGTIPDALNTLIIEAAVGLKAEKAKSLPGENPLSEREDNWSELIPELGLINNAAIIIGPRALTRDADLERRCFLHSYDPLLDKDATILTTILSAPAIVAHWINSQYYFSTVNPLQFGAGNKAVHNVLPGIGVLEGNLSDLKIGLPLQSTHFQSTPIHEPRRITVVVYADKAVLDKSIEQSPDFKTLLENQWIYLKHIQPQAS